MYILNAFSASMLASFPSNVKFEEIDTWCAQVYAQNAVSAVGHADTASLFSSLIRSVNIPANRVSVTLAKGDKALLGQYTGPRLPEGCTRLPEGSSIRWILVTVE